MAAPGTASPRTMEEKKRSAVKVVTTLFPRIPKVTTLLLDFFIRREGMLDLRREPLCHFCQEEVVLAAQDLLEKLNTQVITYQDVRDTAENLVHLHNLCFKKAQDIAKTLGESIRKVIIIVGELATSLEKVSDVPPTDWMGVGDTIVAKTGKLNLAEIAPFWAYIPKMSDFECIKLLGAGGFGAVYKASYKPSRLVCTVKLVSCSLFQRHKQAVIDKVCASVISSPFLVRYYCCYCTKDAYITAMEYICGVDLMRVMDKAVYLPTEQCRIVMAQLILAIEHMHLRGLLHRDIKVSNMLILPGGRVKVIDFDTNKVCVGHFSKRVFKGYFRKTALEFHDGECAGTVPYMAPEILKRRPYGRALDWWSAGVTFYKLMTGRVPFRGETKEELKDKIINQPLKWPKVEEHPHSATPEAKDMVFKMLKKNPVERLGSNSYADIRGHPFYAHFNWKRLSAERDLCNIPAIADIMAGGKLPKEGEKEHLTIGATSKTLKRKLLKMEEMVDIEPSTQRPLYTYSSPGFKKMVNYVKKQGGPVSLKDSFLETSAAESAELDYRNRSDTDVRTGISAYSGTGGAQDRSITAKERMDVILYRTKSLGKYWSFGISIVGVEGENNRKFYMVDRVTKGSPADVSHVLEGDFIVSVNGRDVAALPISEIQRRMQDTGDQLVLTVLSSSAFRLLESRRDMDQIIKAAGHDTMQLRAIRTTCGGSGNYGFKTFEAKAWNETKRALVHCHVVQTVSDPQVITPNKRIFPGDVLLMVGGTPVENMDQYAVRAALAKGANEITITIAPMSPVRVKRPSYTRLHETIMTDENLPEPSARAQIQR
ncbi:hypothetical protein HPB48_021333 [Haemaphysalis longicornis]|uniref:Serine/threonine-protein kinase greatwall n=1 Tax=Haemaphysalis longicornis TaxID=44386 RepID=A0A9J6GKB4_HAELO|nr:hypothetical protein HPB48_021333 [Haemaphysalis longicornis]